MAHGYTTHHNIWDLFALSDYSVPDSKEPANLNGDYLFETFTIGRNILKNIIRKKILN